MTTDPATINRIVSEVLKRIEASKPPVRNSAKQTKQVVVAEHVITEEVLQKCNGQKSLQFQTDAIITPAARDYLKEKRICWSRVCDAAVGESQENSSRLLIAVHMTPVVKSVLADMKNNNTFEHWRQELVGCVGEAEKLAVSSLCRAEAEHVLVICRETYELVYKANRNSKVRAAAIGDLTSFLEAKAQIDPNIIAVNPVDLSFISLRNLIRKACSN